MSWIKQNCLINGPVPLFMRVAANYTLAMTIDSKVWSLSFNNILSNSDDPSVLTANYYRRGPLNATINCQRQVSSTRLNLSLGTIAWFYYVFSIQKSLPELLRLELKVCSLKLTIPFPFLLILCPPILISTSDNTSHSFFTASLISLQQLHWAHTESKVLSQRLY